VTTDPDPHDPQFFHSEIARPTANSSWLSVIVLAVGVALAGWYILGRSGAQRLMATASLSSPAAINETSVPKPPQ
jgi:nitric oxide reductase large subunit